MTTQLGTTAKRLGILILLAMLLSIGAGAPPTVTVHAAARGWQAVPSGPTNYDALVFVLHRELPEAVRKVSKDNQDCSFFQDPTTKEYWNRCAIYRDGNKTGVSWRKWVK